MLYLTWHTAIHCAYPLRYRRYNNHPMFIPCISPGHLVPYLSLCMVLMHGPYSLAEHPARRADLANVVLPLMSLFSKCRLFFSPCLTLLNVLRVGPLCLGDGKDGELRYKGSLGCKLLSSSLHTFATLTWGSRVILAYQRRKT
jgi:hypothetical protein